MYGIEEQLSGMETYLKQVNNPATAGRIRGWMQRLVQIKTNPDCQCLEDLGVRIRPTIDLSKLYPIRVRKVA